MDPDLSSGVGGHLADAPDAVVGVGAEPELSEAAIAALPAEVFAESLSDYFRAWALRLRNGESGALPIIGGLIAVVIFFQLQQSTFLSATNLVNLFVAAAIYVMFGAAELTALLLSEIDLSVGYAGAVAAFIIAEVNQPPVNLPWWVGVIAGVGFVFAFGWLQGTLITRFGLPSFVVTLGGLLALEGIMLELATIDKTALAVASSAVTGSSPVYKLAGSEMKPDAVVDGARRHDCRNGRGVALTRAKETSEQCWLTCAPIGVTLLTIELTAIGRIVLVLICNANTPPGVPWVVPFVLIVLSVFGFVLSRTKLGRYIYAIGANPEAVRRAGVNVALVGRPSDSRSAEASPDWRA